MRITPQRVVVSLLAAALVGAVVWGFVPRPVPVDVGRALRGPLRQTVDADGRTRIRERYVVSTPIGGHVSRIEHHAGDEVKAGETVLAVIRAGEPALLDERVYAQATASLKVAEAAEAQAESAVERARDDLEFARRELERYSALLRTRTVPGAEYDEVKHKERLAASALRAAEFAVKIAAFEKEQAQAALLHSGRAGSAAEAPPYEVRSPISGRVLRVFQESATIVAPATALLEVGDPGDLEILVDVLSADAVRIPAGAPVRLEQWGGEEVLEGRVRLVEPGAFEKVSALGVEEQRVNVVVDFTSPPESWSRLGDAYHVEARIVVWQAEDVLQVPAGALVRRGDAWAVFRVEGDRAVLRDVGIGHGDGMFSEVLSGLDAGDTVVLSPPDRVLDGVRVVPR
jgi:HlyD family secretion protein